MRSRLERGAGSMESGGSVVRPTGWVATATWESRLVERPAPGTAPLHSTVASASLPTNPWFAAYYVVATEKMKLL
jgi:hypothetical protein